MRQKFNFLGGVCYITSRVKLNTAFHKKNIIPTVEQGGGSVMVWSCFAASGPGFCLLPDNSEAECRAIGVYLNPIEMLWHDLKPFSP